MEAELLSRLSHYADYLESSKDHVISEAVRYIIDRDKDFSENRNSPQTLPQISPQNLQRSGAGK